MYTLDIYVFGKKIYRDFSCVFLLLVPFKSSSLHVCHWTLMSGRVSVMNQIWQICEMYQFGTASDLSLTLIADYS